MGLLFLMQRCILLNQRPMLSI
uniref:Uncharacterized protein n=1 Tax=Arundo donax TaxID=35708 RepID=A0A0A9E6U1_ARUDO